MKENEENKHTRLMEFTKGCYCEETQAFLTTSELNCQEKTEEKNIEIQFS